MPVSRAEWLEGMPPVSTSTAGRQRRCTTSSISSLETWASPQAASPQASTPLLKKACKRFGSAPKPAGSIEAIIGPYW